MKDDSLLETLLEILWVLAMNGIAITAVMVGTLIVSKTIGYISKLIKYIQRNL